MLMVGEGGQHIIMLNREQNQLGKTLGAGDYQEILEGNKILFYHEITLCIV